MNSSLDRIDSILRDEELLHKIADHTAEELKQVLIELAYKVDGRRLEDLRCKEPFAPGCWTVDQWKEFFERIPFVDMESIKRRGLPPQESRILFEEHERLKKTLVELQNELACEVPLRKTSIAPFPQESDEPCSSFSNNKEIPFVYHEIIPTLPKVGSRKLPERQRKIFSESQYLFRRELMVLNLLATQGFNSRIELELILGLTEKVEARSHTIKKVLDVMTSKELIRGDILYFENPFSTCLNIVQLTRKGTECCWDLGWDPCESEWERITRLKGDNNSRYTLSLLVLALHARVRSHRVSILPEEDAYSGTDILVIGKDGRKYPTFVLTEGGINFRAVEEVLKKAGNIAICGMDPVDRRRILEECDKKGIHPENATDIKSLVFASTDHSRPIPIMKIPTDSALWTQGQSSKRGDQELDPVCIEG
jgi:hypothetical protein